MKSRILSAIVLAGGLLVAGQAIAQQQAAPAAPTAPPDLNAIPDKMPFNLPFGTPITMDRAQGLVQAAGRSNIPCGTSRSTGILRNRPRASR